MGKLIRAISEDGSVMTCVIDSTDIVTEIEKIHQSSAVITAALGRLASAGAIMGSLLKNENDTVTLRVNANGPSGLLIAVANSHDGIKAYVENPVVELPLNKTGKLDVGNAVGKNGFLSVVKDLKLKEPYVGQTPLISGEIAEDIANYYAASEQIPTVCGLGVLVNPDLTVKSAGGYIIQLLPYADTSCIDIIEENVKKSDPISSMISSGKSPEEICEILLNGLSPKVLETRNVTYTCDCSRKRVARMLSSIKKSELKTMRDEDKGCEVSCHFCGNKYYFSEKQLSKIIEQ